MKDICPCPNTGCPNHGDCAKCTASHVRKGYLSYCSFHTILPTIRDLIAADPDSPTARKLDALIQPQLEAYEKMKAANSLSQADLDKRLAKVAEYGAE